MATPNQQIRRVLGVLEISPDFLNPMAKNKYSVLVQFWTYQLLQLHAFNCIRD
jgi:hypothetical protein